MDGDKEWTQISDLPFMNTHKPTGSIIFQLNQ